MVRLIALDPWYQDDVPRGPRVCRICGYECGLVATGCAYPGYGESFGDRIMRAYHRPSTVTFYVRPVLPPEDPPVERPETPVPPRKRPAETAFVGGGAMRRRWR